MDAPEEAATSSSLLEETLLTNLPVVYGKLLNAYPSKGYVQGGFAA